MKTPELTPEFRSAGLIDWLNSLRADVAALEYTMLSEAAEPEELEYMRQQRTLNLTRIRELENAVEELEKVIELNNRHIQILQEENMQLRQGNPITYHISYSPDGD
jgi:methionine synthase II (cobalamin-independent)